MDKKQKIQDLIYDYKWNNKPLEETIDAIDKAYNSQTSEEPLDIGGCITITTSSNGGSISYSGSGQLYVGAELLDHVCPNNSWQLRFWGNMFNLMNHWQESPGHPCIVADFNDPVDFSQIEAGEAYLYRVMNLGKETDTYLIPHRLNNGYADCLGFVNPNHTQPHYGFCVDGKTLAESDLKQPNHHLYKIFRK